MKLIWVEFLFGGMQRGYNFDLGVREYQKVENPWPIALVASGHFFALEAFSNTLLRVFLVF